MTIDIYKALFELEHLVETIPLSQADRVKYRTNIQAMRKVASEWEKLKEDGEKNK